MSEIEDTMSRLTSQRGVLGIILMNSIGEVMRSTLDEYTGKHWATTIMQLAARARSVVRDMDPQNDLAFIKVKTKLYDIMVAPDREYVLILVQDPNGLTRPDDFTARQHQFTAALRQKQLEYSAPETAHPQDHASLQLEYAAAHQQQLEYAAAQQQQQLEYAAALQQQQQLEYAAQQQQQYDPAQQQPYNYGHEQHAALAQQQFNYASAGEAVAPVVESETLSVQVPEGSGPGSVVAVQAPDGQVVQVMVPDGANPGDVFAVAYSPASGMHEGA
jgi:dynein light chain roadblock-type